MYTDIERQADRIIALSQIAGEGQFLTDTRKYHKCNPPSVMNKWDLLTPGITWQCHCKKKFQLTEFSDRSHYLGSTREGYTWLKPGLFIPVRKFKHEMTNSWGWNNGGRMIFQIVLAVLMLVAFSMGMATLAAIL